MKEKNLKERTTNQDTSISNYGLCVLRQVKLYINDNNKQNIDEKKKIKSEKS